MQAFRFARSTSAAALLLCAALQSCSGGPSRPASSSLLPASSSNSSADATSVSVDVRLNLASGAATATASRRPLYVSPSTQSVSVTAGSSTKSYNTADTNYCVSGVCNVFFSLPSGSQSFTIAAYDGVLDASGDPQGTLLSKVTVSVNIVAGSTNVVKLSMRPVLAAVQLVPSVQNSALQTFVAGTSATMNVTVNALDPDGNIIVDADRFITTSGSPTTIALKNTDTTGNTVASKTVLYHASATPVSITYNGKSFGGVYPYFRAIAPNVKTVSILLAMPGFYAANGLPINETLGADGNLWGLYAGGIEKYVPSTAAVTYYPVSSGTGFSGLAQGPDGNLYVEEGTQNLDRITPSGVLSQIINVVGGTYSTLAYGPMVAGSDGNMWMISADDPCALAGKGSCGGWYVVVVSPNASSGARMTRIIPNASVGGYSVAPSGYDYAGVLGSDKNFYWTQKYAGNTAGGEKQSGAIDEITPTGGIHIHQMPAQHTSTVGEKIPQDVVLGGDGNVWFAAYANNLSDRLSYVEIGKLTTSGTITEYPLPAQYNLIWSLTEGEDGNIYFVTSTMGTSGVGGTPYLGEVNVSTGKLTVTPGVSNISWGDANSASWHRGYEVNGMFYFGELGLTMVD